MSLRVAGRPCLVVGGGPVAARKVAGLAGCGALVTVVAPEIVPAIERLATPGVGRPGEPASTAGVGQGPHASEEDGVGAPAGPSGTVTVERRRYRPGEAGRFRLVITATGIPEVDRAVAADAEAAGVWVNAADDAEHCTFLLPSVHRDGTVSVAVATGGASPALATWLRRRIAAWSGPGLGTLAELLGEARRRLQGAGRSTEMVDWQALLDGPLPDLVRQGDLDAARALLRQATAGPPPTAGPP